MGAVLGATEDVWPGALLEALAHEYVVKACRCWPAASAINAGALLPEGETLQREDRGRGAPSPEVCCGRPAVRCGAGCAATGSSKHPLCCTKQECRLRRLVQHVRRKHCAEESPDCHRRVVGAYARLLAAPRRRWMRPRDVRRCWTSCLPWKASTRVRF